MIANALDKIKWHIRKMIEYIHNEDKLNKIKSLYEKFGGSNVKVSYDSETKDIKVVSSMDITNIFLEIEDLEERNSFVLNMLQNEVEKIICQ